MRPIVSAPVAPTYECPACATRFETGGAMRCPGCGTYVVNVARSRDW